MAISKEKKNEIIAQYARHEGDTGSVEVQVARYLPWFDEKNRSPS